jgi:hypothetical protein
MALKDELVGVANRSSGNQEIMILINLMAFSVLVAAGPEAAASRPDSVVSPINGAALEAIELGRPYSFWVAGHLYGSHGNQTSIFPASSFLANVDRLRDSGASLLVLVGDNFRRPEPLQIAQFQRLMRRLPFPVFNAPGNHDHPESEHYQQHFGRQSYRRFQGGACLFLVLDSELDDGRISGPQLERLLNWLAEAEGDRQIKNVFLFSHHLVWCADHPVLSSIRPYLNSAKHLHQGWFAERLGPALERLAQEKCVYWFSGDVGATWSYSTFYWKDPQRNLYYLATGLGDTSRDAILRVHVDAQGGVNITPISLADRPMLPIESYGVHFWDEFFAQRRAPSPASSEAPGAGSLKTPARAPGMSPARIVSFLLIGLVAAWMAFRLISIGWQRFRTIRTKYYSFSSRRGE